MNLSRTSGVQLHPTSLPSGRLGPDAYAWVDWLADAGQTWWQMLPLGPPDEHGSPYKSASAFAASPRLLAEPGAPVTAPSALDFRERAADWIEDWIAFAGRGRARRPGALRPRVGARCARYAAERGVKLIGDIPIYVADGLAPTSSPTRRSSRPARWPACRRTRSPTRASCGATRSTTGRRCGAAATPGGSRASGASSSSSTSPGSTTSAASPPTGPCPRTPSTRSSGAWKRGPGRAPFDAARAALGELPLIAEDLGVITPPVKRLRESLGLPGMAVLQFGFTPSERHTQHVPGEQRGEPGRLHRHPRQRHDPRLVRRARAPSSAGWSPTTLRALRHRRTPSRTGR